MARKRDYHLNNDELAAIEDAMAYDKRREVVQRATSIRLLHLGYKLHEVAEMLAVSYPSVWRWHDWFRSGGIERLANQPRSGRPNKATETYVQVLAETLDHEPAAYGYDFALWTVERLVEHLAQQTGIHMY